MATTTNKAQLVEKIAERTGLTKNKAAEALNAVLDSITDSLQVNGDKLVLVGFGTFDRAKYQGRVGRNPSTGEQINIQSKLYNRFKASKITDELLG